MLAGKRNANRAFREFHKNDCLVMAQRNQAIEMLICGTSHRQIAKFFWLHTLTITHVWYRYQSTGTSHYRTEERPKSLSYWHLRRIIRQHTENPTLAAAETGRSDSTPAQFIGACGGHVYDAVGPFSVQFCLLSDERRKRTSTLGGAKLSRIRPIFFKSFDDLVWNFWLCQNPACFMEQPKR